MPSRKVHEWFDKLILGKKTNVHKLMDYPAKFLGKKHRVLFHGPEVPLFFLSLGKNDEAISSIGHILLDKTFKGKTAKLLEVFIK